MHALRARRASRSLGCRTLRGYHTWAVSECFPYPPKRAVIDLPDVELTRYVIPACKDGRVDEHAVGVVETTVSEDENAGVDLSRLAFVVQPQAPHTAVFHVLHGEVRNRHARRWFALRPEMPQKALLVRFWSSHWLSWSGDPTNINEAVREKERRVFQFDAVDHSSESDTLADNKVRSLRWQLGLNGAHDFFPPQTELVGVSKCVLHSLPVRTKYDRPDRRTPTATASRVARPTRCRSACSGCTQGAEIDAESAKQTSESQLGLKRQCTAERREIDCRTDDAAP